VAAASLGQVYRARVRETGIEVAVKVQRPGVLEAIAIDMHLLRNAAALAKRLLPWLNTDLVGAVDEWGLRFVDELDYEMEAASALAFRRDVALTPLANVVCAPLPIPSLSSRRVLTAEWVSGVRLDSAPPAEIGKLCAVGLTSYLTMLLETGTLHCDPHPGNLLRTENGRLCILDWGLVTKVEGELQISFLEHIAHLTSRDFAAIPNDLVRLGFVPAGKEEAIAQAGVGEVLANLYMMLSGGGGANKIDVSEVARTLTGLTATSSRFRPTSSTSSAPSPSSRASDSRMIRTIRSSTPASPTSPAGSSPTRRRARARRCAPSSRRRRPRAAPARSTRAARSSSSAASRRTRRRRSA
jgi:predicted unusual protein kinase regulating ubiquinone biosynthesis (AarF/ABC1/UbiB family)